MIKAVIFDFFGVIISDGLELELQRLEADGIAVDRSVITDLLYQSHHGWIARDDSLRQMAAHVKMTPEAWSAAISKGEVVDDRVLNLIRQLRANYKTALLSNISQGGLERRIARPKLDTYFNVIVVSGDVGTAKPEPEIYQLTAKKLGVEVADCVFIDDRPDYAAGARAVGMQAIVYVDFNQAKAELETLLAAA